MAIDMKTVEHTAELAKLNLTEKEKSDFSHQLSDILDFVEKINTIDTEGVEPADHVIDNLNVVREDQPGGCLMHEDLRKNAPGFDRGHFVVPKIIE